MQSGKFLILCMVLLTGFSFRTNAVRDNLQLQIDYERTYVQLSNMLKAGSTDFKTAVFMVEKTYYSDSLSYEIFDNKIKFLSSLAIAYQLNNHLSYKESDSLIVKKYAALFKVMTDSLPVSFRGTTIYHSPYTYNFEDFDGSARWSDMFVSTLLDTHKGNCHSMPYLYKILAQELGVDAWLSLAPNHTYIKLFSKKTGWYNTELTSGDFPIDAWIMASGYVHISSIQNGVYMDTISDQKSLAMCLVDLAQGYEALNGKGSDSFILKCCNTSLQYYPNYINALLLQTKIYEYWFSKSMKASGFSSVQEYASKDAVGKIQFEQLNTLIKRIHALGYRRMPRKMYLAWLSELKTQRAKYTNKKITNFTR